MTPWRSLGPTPPSQFSPMAEGQFLSVQLDYTNMIVTDRNTRSSTFREATIAQFFNKVKIQLGLHLQLNASF